MSAGELIKKARKLKRSGRLDETIAVYQEAIELNPNFAWTYYELGTVWAQLENWEEAIACYERALKINSKFVSVYHDLGEILSQLSQQELEYFWAKDLVLKILPIPEPLKSSVSQSDWFDDGYFLQATQDFNNEKFLREAYHTYLGYEVDTNENEEYLTLLADNTTRAEIISKIRYLWKDREEFQKLIKIIKISQLNDTTFLEKTKVLNNSDFVREVYSTYLQREADEMGLKRFTLWLSNDGCKRQEMVFNIQKSLEFKNVIGSAYEIAGDATVRQVVKLDPHSHQGHYLLGNIMAKQEKFAEAIACYKKSLLLKPNFNKAKLKIASFEKSEQQLEIISIHVPKTAGTTFRDILMQVYSESKICMDYAGGGEYKSFLYLSKRDAKVIHGHFPVSKYEPFFPNAKRIIWLRNPIDRVISFYSFSKYSVPEQNAPLSNEIKKGKVKIEQFAAILNKQVFEYTNGRKLADFFFIGVQEYFEEDILELKQMLGWPEINVKVRANVNPYYQEDYLKIVSDRHLTNKLSEILATEIEIYQEALRLREQRKNKL